MAEGSCGWLRETEDSRGQLRMAEDGCRGSMDKSPGASMEASMEYMPHLLSTRNAW